MLGARIYSGPVLAFAVLAASCTGTSDDATVRSEWFADHGITFVVPDSWEERGRDEYRPEAPAWGVLLSPDRSSGNWIAFYYYPPAVAAEFNATPDTFESGFDDFIGDPDLILRHGPTRITVAGLPGREFGVAGMVVEKPGVSFESEAVMLFGEAETYALQVQYEPGSEDMMLSAWKTMLSQFSVSSP
jgi:hypothetical protein